MNRRPALPGARADDGSPDNADIDKVAQAVQGLLGAKAAPRLSRRLRQWPQVEDGAEDFCQLASIAFVEAYRRGRIEPDPQAGVHTADSVSAYAWGIVNRLFANAVRRSRPATDRLDANGGKLPPPLGQAELDSLEELTAGGPGDIDDRLWEVLSRAAGRCRPEDIVVAYLLANGVPVSEVSDLFGVSRNTPANALRRVGSELRAMLGLGTSSGGDSPVAHPDDGTESAATGRLSDGGKTAAATGELKDGGTAAAATDTQGDTP